MLPLTLRHGLASDAGRLARRQRQGRRTRGSRPGRGGFDKGTLAAALIGYCGQARSQPDSRTSVRATAPCQIRRSVRAGLTLYCRRPRMQKSAATISGVVWCSVMLLSLQFVPGGIEHHFTNVVGLSEVCDTAGMTFQESFWLAASTAAPVIALAAAVAVPDSATAVRMVSVLWFPSEARKRFSQLLEDRNSPSLDKVSKSEPEDLEGKSLDEVYQTLTHIPLNKLYSRAINNQRLSLFNVIIQAILLAISLTALGYDEDIIPQWAAIILAVGGILLLVQTLATGAFIRTQLDNRKLDKGSSPLDDYYRNTPSPPNGGASPE